MLGTVRMETGHAAEATELYAQAIERCRAIGFRRGEGINLVNRGNVQYVRGRLGAALADYGSRGRCSPHSTTGAARRPYGSTSAWCATLCSVTTTAPSHDWTPPCGYFARSATTVRGAAREALAGVALRAGRLDVRTPRSNGARAAGHPRRRVGDLPVAPAAAEVRLAEGASRPRTTSQRGARAGPRPRPGRPRSRPAGARARTGWPPGTSTGAVASTEAAAGRSTTASNAPSWSSSPTTTRWPPPGTPTARPPWPPGARRAVGAARRSDRRRSCPRRGAPRAPPDPRGAADVVAPDAVAVVAAAAAPRGRPLRPPRSSRSRSTSISDRTHRTTRSSVAASCCGPSPSRSSRRAGRRPPPTSRRCWTSARRRFDATCRCYGTPGTRSRPGADAPADLPTASDARPRVPVRPTMSARSVHHRLAPQTVRRHRARILPVSTTRSPEGPQP